MRDPTKKYEIIICEECRGVGTHRNSKGEEVTCCECEGSGKLKQTTIIETFQSKVEEAIRSMTEDHTLDSQFKWMKEKRIEDYHNMNEYYKQQISILEKKIDELENVHSNKI